MYQSQAVPSYGSIKPCSWGVHGDGVGVRVLLLLYATLAVRYGFIPLYIEYGIPGKRGRFRLYAWGVRVVWLGLIWRSAQLSNEQGKTPRGNSNMAT